MEVLTAIVGVPLMLGVLSAGLGLLVDRLAGGWLPLVLVIPVGFAVLVGVTQLTVASDAVAPATVAVAPLVAAFGLWVGRARLRAGLSGLRRSPWSLLDALAVYVIA